MTASLRTRLTWGVFLSTTLLLGLLCIILYTVTRNTLISQFDSSLLSTAKMLSALIDNEGFEEHHERGHEEHAEYSMDTEADFEFDVRMTPEFNNLHGGGYYQLWDGTGTLIASSPSLGKAKLPFFDSKISTPIFQQCQLPNDKQGRAVSYKFTDGSKEESHGQNSYFTVIAARQANKLYSFLRFFKILLLIASAAVIFLSVFVAVKVAQVGLKPVHTLANEIDSVDEMATKIYFSAKSYPVELSPICDCLNSLMERIQSSFLRERQFNADVAHELRTPLAGIQSTIEVCLSRSRQPEEYQHALENCMEINKAMNRLTSTLLALSRLESQQITLQKQVIPLKDLIEQTWQSFADKAYDKQINREVQIDESLSCLTDKDHLRMIITNLMDNAVEYCDNQGQIQITAQRNENQIILTISNSGCNLKTDDIEHVFEFFWRADTARTNTGIHCGIGLTVVQKISNILGIQVKAEIKESSIFTISLYLSGSTQSD